MVPSRGAGTDHTPGASVAEALPRTPSTQGKRKSRTRTGSQSLGRMQNRHE